MTGHGNVGRDPSSARSRTRVEGLVVAGAIEGPGPSGAGPIAESLLAGTERGRARQCAMRPARRRSAIGEVAGDRALRARAAEAVA